ncbi:MAG: hypothetical protein ACLRPX_05525 [Ruthenibacterium sp.]
MKRFLAVYLALCLAMALFAVPVFAEGAAEPTGSGDTFFANGTPITITAAAPQGGQETTLGDLNEGEDAYISWVSGGVTKYVGVSTKATVYGGSDGRQAAVSVPSTSITMTGGTVRNLIGGNLGAKAKEPLATVTGDVTMRISGDAKVVNYIAGGGYDNACVNGTVSLTLDGVNFDGLDPYVNGGVWGHGSEGTRDIEKGTMDTQAVAHRVEIKVTNSQNIPLLGVGGGGSTKVNSGSLTVTNSSVNALYLGGINGETGSCEVTLNNANITDMAATNRGFVGSAVVNVNGGRITNFYTGAAPGCFGSDSGTVDGSAVTGSITWNLDANVQVANAVITPNIKSKPGQYTAEVGNVAVNKQGDALNMKADVFEPTSDKTVNEFTVPAGETLKLEGTKLTIPEGTALKNEGTVENRGTIENKGTIENMGSGKLDNVGENAAISGNKPVGDNPGVTYQFISGPASYTLGTQKDAVFTLNGSVDQFVDFYIDGTKLVKDTDYTVKNGSVVITVKASVMEKLSVGSHTLKASYTLGEATGSVTIEKQAQAPTTPAAPSTGKANPKTGVNL